MSRSSQEVLVAALCCAMERLEPLWWEQHGMCKAEEASEFLRLHLVPSALALLRSEKMRKRWLAYVLYQKTMLYGREENPGQFLSDTGHILDLIAAHGNPHEIMTHLIRRDRAETLYELGLGARAVEEMKRSLADPGWNLPDYHEADHEENRALLAKFTKA